jgi:hypothetical protein
MAKGSVRIAGIALEVLRKMTTPGTTTVYQHALEVLREGNAVPEVQHLVVEVLRERSTAPSGRGVVFVVCS